MKAIRSGSSPFFLLSQACSLGLSGCNKAEVQPQDLIGEFNDEHAYR